MNDKVGNAESRCTGCGAPFECGASAEAPCWCAALPAVAPDAKLAGCYCRSCLEKLTAATPQST
jgi:hypothetical protein